MGSAASLSIQLGVPQEVAQRFVDATFNRYPRLRPWQEESVAFAREHGYVLSSYGNRRHLGDALFSEDGYIRTKAERQATNAQVQMSGSDIMKVILSTMHKERVLQDCGGSLIVPPYDEVCVSVPRETAWDCWLQMKEIMAVTPPGNAVPQLPELKASALNWGECSELGAEPTEGQLDELFDQQLAQRNAA
jgi:DNA polymerase-1